MTESPVAVPAGMHRPSRWRMADVLGVRIESPTAHTLVLQVPDWPGHLAGQHIDVRLTAPDGYRAQRSYSIADAVDLAEPNLI